MQRSFLKQREKFRTELTRCYGVSDEEYNEVNRYLAPYARHFRAAKGDYLQRQGELARAVHWLTEGVARNGFISEAGADVTIRFAMEGWNANAHEDLLAVTDGAVAVQFIVAETAVSGFYWTWDDLRLLRATHPLVGEYYLKVLEHMVRFSARRTYAFAAGSALDRLTAFRLDYPGLEQRISQRVLASYLGVTQPYLSRILSANPPKA